MLAVLVHPERNGDLSKPGTPRQYTSSSAGWLSQVEVPAYTNAGSVQ